MSARSYAHLLTETAHYQQVEGQDPFTGDPILGPVTPFRCRSEGGPKLVRDRDGAEVVSNSRLLTDVEIVLDARIWPPDKNPNTDPYSTPKAVTSAATLDGRARLYEVNL